MSPAERLCFLTEKRDIVKAQAIRRTNVPPDYMDDIWQEVVVSFTQIDEIDPERAMGLLVTIATRKAREWRRREFGSGVERRYQGLENVALTVEHGSESDAILTLGWLWKEMTERQADLIRSVYVHQYTDDELWHLYGVDAAYTKRAARMALRKLKKRIR